MKPKFSIALFIALNVLLSQSLYSSASSKEWTINARQDQLMKDINEAQKKKELTEKEAKKLRSDLASVARKEAKLKAKNQGEVPTAEKAQLEAQLNDVSVKIKSLSLEKRVVEAKEAGAAEKKKQKEAEKADEKKSKGK